MKITGRTRLLLTSVASALMIIPVVNGTSAIADDNVTISEVRGSVQPATLGKITDEPRGQNMDRQPLGWKQSPGPVVDTRVDPGDTSAFPSPRPHCELSFAPAWSTPLWSCS